VYAVYIEKFWHSVTYLFTPCVFVGLLGVTPLEFRSDLWHQSSWDSGLSYDTNWV